MDIKTVDQAFAYIEAFTNFEKAPDLTKRGYRLDRLVELCRLFNSPQLGSKAIHIAGSKGKGSTATFVASILYEAGFKTGIYTSPHLLSYTERIALMGEDPDEPLFIELVNRLKVVIDKLNSSNSDEDVLPGGNSPTTFELLTLLAFLYFKEKGCDYVVYETGLGGRLDATNVVDPELSIITPIELEHTDLLGDTLEKIAAEKGGIIKQGKPVFVARQKPEVTRILRDIADEKGSVYTEVSEICQTILLGGAEDNTKGEKVRFVCKRDDSSIEIEAVPGLPGAIQRENAALALAAVINLFSRDGINEIGTEVLIRGIEKATLRGRMEILRREPLFMIDSAHTPASVDAVVDYFFSLMESLGNKVLIFGCVADKKADRMIEILSPLFDKVIVCRPGTFKKSDPEALFLKFLEQPCFFNERKEDVKLLVEGRDALAEALSLCGDDGAVLVTGSFFLAAEICKAWEGLD